MSRRQEDQERKKEIEGTRRINGKRGREQRVRGLEGRRGCGCVDVGVKERESDRVKCAKVKVGGSQGAKSLLLAACCLCCCVNCGFSNSLEQ